MHAHKCWQLKPRFSHYFAWRSEGFGRLKDLLFEDIYRGAEDRAALQGHIGELLIRNTADALNDGRKYCITVISWKPSRKENTRTHRTSLSRKNRSIDLLVTWLVDPHTWYWHSSSGLTAIRWCEFHHNIVKPLDPTWFSRVYVNTITHCKPARQ